MEAFLESLKNRRYKTKSYDLIQLATEIGLTPQYISTHYATLKEHDSVRINLINNSFRRYSNGAGGDAVAFLMEFGSQINTQFSSVFYCLNYLERQMNLSPETRKFVFKPTDIKVTKDLYVPEKDDNNRRIFAYLTKTRAISQDVVQYFVKNNYLYQSKMGKNCVFVGRDEEGKIQYITQRGTLSDRRFMLESEGCNYDFGFTVYGKNPYILCVFEAAIDMLSFIDLKSERDPQTKQIHILNNDYSFLSMGSTQKTRSLEHYLEKHHQDLTFVNLCLDDDEAGNLTNQKIKDYIKENYPKIVVNIIKPKGKDFNEELVHSKQNLITQQKVQNKGRSR